MILKELVGLDAVEIHPHDAEVYNPDAVIEKGFRYIGTLSPRLQRLGTVLNQKKKLQDTEREAFKSRTKEVEESRSLTATQKLGILTEELPSRLEALAKLEMLVVLLKEIFDFEMVYEMKFKPDEDAPTPTTFGLKIYHDWEVAVKAISDVRTPSGPPLEKPISKEVAPRQGGQHSHRHGSGINFTGKHGEA